MSAAEPQAATNHKLRWFQYRLRTLLLLMLLVSIGMSVWAVRTRRGKNQIADALRSPTTIEFVETSLVDVVDYLKDSHRIDIGIDPDAVRALRAAGIDKDIPVTFIMKGCSLQSSLRLMLRGLGLTYVVRDKALWITTPQLAATSGGSAITVETSPLNDWKIAEAMKQTTVIEFTETPLKDVVDYLKDVHHIEIQLDPKVFAQVYAQPKPPMRDPEMPVTLDHKTVSLQSALRIILRELDLDYALCDEVILITTHEEARALNPVRRDFRSPGIVANEKRIAAVLASPPPANLKGPGNLEGMEFQALADELKERNKIAIHITAAALEYWDPFGRTAKPNGDTLAANLTATFDRLGLQYEIRDETLLITPKPKVAP